MKVYLTESQLARIFLDEEIEGDSPNLFTFEGEEYEALKDSSIPLLFHNGKWISNGETHRDIISMCKFGCEEWEIENYYSYDQSKRMHNELDRLWSEDNEFQYPSRLFDAKGKVKDKGIKYILVSWDQLDEPMIQSICHEFNLNRNDIAYNPSCWADDI